MENMQIYIKHPNQSFGQRIARSFSMCDFVDAHFGDGTQLDCDRCIVISFDENDRNIYERFARLTLDESEEQISEDINIIYFFTSARHIVNKLKYIYGYIDNLENVRESSCKLISLVSERGGSGTTTAAIALTNILDSRFIVKAAYLSLSAFNFKAMELLGLSSDNNDSSITEFIYSLKAREDTKLDDFLKVSHGILHFPISSMNMRISDLDGSLIDKIAKLLSSRSVEYLVIDIGSNLSKQANEVLEKSNKIIMINSPHLEKYMGDKAETFKLIVDINGDADVSDIEPNRHIISFCKKIELKSFDEEYGFELEKFLEQVVDSGEITYEL